VRKNDFKIISHLIILLEMLMKENIIDKKYSGTTQLNVTNIDNTLMDFIFQFSHARKYF